MFDRKVGDVFTTIGKIKRDKQCAAIRYGLDVYVCDSYSILKFELLDQRTAFSQRLQALVCDTIICNADSTP